MERIAFKMYLNAGCEMEYKKRHDEIWPELSSALRKVGIHDYSIFLDKETNTLIGVFKVADNEFLNRLQGLPVMQKWWAYMSDLMATNEDNSPISKKLEEVFNLT